MGKSDRPSILEKMQLLLTLLTNLLDRGRNVVRELLPPILNLDPIQKVLLFYLNSLMKLIPHSSIKT